MEYSGTGEWEDLSYVSKTLRKIVGWVLKNGLMGADFWNINFPTKPTNKIKMVRMIDAGYYVDTVKRGRNYFVNFSIPTRASKLSRINKVIFS